MCTLQRLLQDGHSVSALVRNPKALAQYANNSLLTIVEGDVRQRGDAAKIVTDSVDVVVSCLGTGTAVGKD